MAPNPQWVKDLKPAGPQGHELLAKERDSSNINIQKLSEFLHTKKELDRKYRILKVLESEKVFDKSQNYFAGRIDRFETSLARAKRLRQLTVKLGWDKDDFNTANELLSESTPYRLHDSMFLVSLAISLCQTHKLTITRSHFVTKAHQNSTKSSSRKPRTLR
jgi:acyl-CoA oxidase